MTDPQLRLIASYAYKRRKGIANVFGVGEGLVGQAALERKAILITQAPEDYITIASGLGEAAPVNIVVLPVLFEDQVMAVIELASFTPFSDAHLTFLEQLSETIGVVLNTIVATMRTEELLQQSQRLTQELQSQSEELQSQQDELKRTNQELEEQARSLKASEELLQEQQEELQQTNEELEEKAPLLAEQNARIEQKNREVEAARVALEEKAEQLALSSKYKSEFLANMSHELRTPLNSLLILAKLLADNKEGTLNEKQVEFARTIYNAGTDLLELINDILDLSKVEAGKMDVNAQPVEPAAIADYVERTFRPVAEQKALDFDVDVADDLPATIVTDEQRLQQVLKNLLSNAFKFTERGAVTLTVAPAPQDARFCEQTLRNAASVVRVRGGGHRHRHPGGQAAADLRGVPAGRRHDVAPLRRHRARPLDQPRDRAAARRRDPRRVDVREGHDVHALPAGRRAAARSGAGRAGARRRSSPPRTEARSSTRRCSCRSSRGSTTTARRSATATAWC